MKSRCNNSKHDNYARYGARGIRCEFETYEIFKQWALSNGYQEGLQIDRIDNNGNYTPDNCRWVDVKTNCNNRSDTQIVTVDGMTKSITEWADYLGVNKWRIFNRIHKDGWVPEDIIEYYYNKHKEGIK